MQPIAKEHHSTIISRIKVMSELDISERRVPQDGRFRVRYNARSIDFPRLHHAVDPRRRRRAPRARQRIDEREVPQAHAGRGRLQRRRPAQVPPLHQGALRHGAGDRPNRLGKTTTLYAALNEIKTDEDKLITIEDPVEYQIRGITQIPVNEKRA
jgi:type IV pilus assembly protein PilB